MYPLSHDGRVGIPVSHIHPYLPSLAQIGFRASTRFSAGGRCAAVSKTLLEEEVMPSLNAPSDMRVIAAFSCGRGGASDACGRSYNASWRPTAMEPRVALRIESEA